MIKNKNIVITGLQSWDIKIGSNCKNIAIEFSRHNRVLYVNPPTDLFSTFRDKESVVQIRKLKGEINNGLLLKEVLSNIWVLYPQSVLKPVSRLPLNWLFDRWNKENNELFASEIKRAMDHLDMKTVIHFCDSDMYRSLYVKELLNPDLFIYYTRDNLMAVKYWKVHGLRIEPLIMAKADMVLANSVYLAERASKFNKRSYFIGQGCDLSEFSPSCISYIPKDIKDIVGIKIGYVGSLNTLRLDIGIIERIATRNPQWSIVLVGPEDEVFKKSRLHHLSNVYFLGSKDVKELPSYLNCFDVAINPQVLNEVTQGNYPRKIDVYLAMGKPVVATRSRAMEYFLPYVALASGYEDWDMCIKSELSNNSRNKEKQRIAFASEHSWANNVNEIYKRLSQFECVDNYSS